MLSAAVFNRVRSRVFVCILCILCEGAGNRVLLGSFQVFGPEPGVSITEREV